MERKIPKSHKLRAFVAELESKKEKLIHTIDNHSGQCSQELTPLTQQVQELSTKLLLAENDNDSASVEQYEGQIAEIKKQIAMLHQKGSRYDGVGLEQLFMSDFPKLKQYASECRDERQKILSDIDLAIADRDKEIKKLQLELSALGQERSLYHADFEADCVASVIAYMPGGDNLNSYIPGSIDFTRRQQINHMLFE